MTGPAAPPLPPELDALVRRMRLPYLRKAAPDVLATARAQRWEPAEVLRVLLAEEVTGRDAATRRMRRKTAAFPSGKTFSSWRPEESSIPEATQNALITLEWVGRAENLVIAGPSGTGKSHFAEAVAHVRLPPLDGHRRFGVTRSQFVVPVKLLVRDRAEHLPRLECRLYGLYQHSIHSIIADASSPLVCHLHVSSSSICMLPQNDSIMALSKQSPTVPIDPRSPDSRRRFPYVIAVYWTSSRDRRNNAGKCPFLCLTYTVSGLVPGAVCRRGRLLPGPWGLPSGAAVVSGVRAGPQGRRAAMPEAALRPEGRPRRLRHPAPGSQRRR